MSSTKYEKSDLFFLARLELLKGKRKQKEFAEWLGESVTTINGYFTSSSRPNIDFLRKLSKKGVNLNWFLTGDGEMYISETKGGRSLSPEIQTLLHELEGHESIIYDLIVYTRSKKKYQKSKRVADEAFELFKTSFGKKKK